MPSAALTPEDAWPTIQQNVATGYNELYQNTVISNNTSGGGLKVISNTADSARTIMMIRFPITPTDPAFITTFRKATLFLTKVGNAYSYLHATVKGHKVANSPKQVGTGTATNRPLYRYNSEGTTRTWALDQDPAPADGFTCADPNGDLTAIVKEIISQPSFVLGSAITLLFLGSNDSANNGDEFRAICALTGNGTQDPNYQDGPNLFLEWGSPDVLAPNFDYTIIGDSWAAFSDQPGFEITFQPNVLFFPNVALHNSPAGLKGTGTLGFAMYGGDMWRGYTANGIFRDLMHERYGDGIDIRQHNHAVGGTLAAQWTDVTTDANKLWGSITVPNTTRYDIAHPSSPSGIQVIMISLGGNDLFYQGSAGGSLLWWHNDVNGGLAWWQNWAMTNVKPWIQAVIDEINACLHHPTATADPSKTYIWLRGYANMFCVNASKGRSTIILANGNSQNYMQQTWCLQANGCWGKWQYMFDCNGGEQAPKYFYTGDGTDIYQGALLRAAILDQRSRFPAEAATGGSFNYNPNGAHWTPAAAGNWAATFGYPLTAETAHTTWNFGSAAIGVGWYYAFRGINDITISRTLKTAIDPVMTALAAANSNVIYTPKWQWTGPDLANSYDPLSIYAQPDGVYGLDGIHYNKDGYRGWLGSQTGPIDQLVAQVPIGLDPYNPADPIAPGGSGYHVAHNPIIEEDETRLG